MTIARDTETVATAYTSTGTQTTSHAGSSSTKAVCVLIDQNGSTTDEVSGVTYGGVTMTRVDSSTEATEAGRVYIYWLYSPPTGTQDVAMTTTAATNKQLVCCTMTGSPYKTIKYGGVGTGTSASVANPSWSITGLTTGRTYLAYEVIHSGLTTMTNTPATNWTLISSTDLGAQGRGFARQTVGNQASGTLTCGWTAATADDFVGDSVVFYEDDNLANNFFGAASADDNSLFEGSTVGNWAGNTFLGGYAADTVANSATRAFEGTKSLLLTHPTDALGSAAGCDVLGLVDGARYTYNVRVWVPTGSADVRAEVVFFATGAYTSTKDAWVELQTDFTANSGLHAFMAVESAAPSTSGQQVWIDRAVMYATNYLTGTAAASATGATGLSTGASLAGTAAATATGTVSKVGNATLTGTGTLTSTGSVAAGALSGDSTLAGTAASSATGARGLATGSTLAGTAASSSAGATGRSTGSTLAGTGTLSSTGARGLATTAAALVATGALTAAGVVGVATGSSAPATGTTTASGVVGRSTGASVVATGTTSATATVGRFGDVTITATGTLTATGSASGASPTGDATLAGTGTLTSTGTVGKVTGSSLAGTASATATGARQLTTGGTLAGTGALTATGTVGKTTGSTLAATGTLTATGTVTRVADASRTGTATATASATVGVRADAARPGVATVTATGAVASDTIPPVAPRVRILSGNASVTVVTHSSGSNLDAATFRATVTSSNSKVTVL